MSSFTFTFAKAALAAACLSAAAVHAAPQAATAIEIDGLFSALLTSGCEFNRNGSWYSAKQASQHLQGKYDYLLKKNLVPTTEAFIDRAASQSSMSSKPYRVRCPGQPETDSKQWFTEQLEQIRVRK
ncbi:hypothetical protein HNP33_000720 [Comamonas odontotermitis]|uniref:DUF5329 domain-containing protein n=1 Tax=Comamonas odontotermitis TaxID=379895 RepID=A0ABR6RC14_9BURK|nr:DUF5329 domain-containing protein [Comamonas odontotermitis]MBB6576672.1 hypothetical protein [Comamonas odontotermitis]